MALTTPVALHLRQAEALVQDSLTVRGAINDRDGLALTNCSLAANYMLSDYPQAEHLLSQSLAFFQRAGNRRWVGRTRRDFGLVAYLRDEFELAVDRLRESVEHFEVLNDRRGMIMLGRRWRWYMPTVRSMRERRRISRRPSNSRWRLGCRCPA